MIMFGKWLEINPMKLGATLQDYKNQYCFMIFSHPQKNGKGLTQWDFVPLGLTLIYTTEERLPTLTTKP